MNEMYEAAAKHFAERVEAMFASEQTLEAAFKLLYPGLPFDRTDHWAHVFETLLNEAWDVKGPTVKGNPTAMDRLHIIRALHPLLDYSLFTQVLLNLQGYMGMFYLTGDAQTQIDRAKNEWKTKGWKSDPFAPKAKMYKQADLVSDGIRGMSLPYAGDPKTAWGHKLDCRCDKCEKHEFNEVVSTLRALRIITQFTPQISFRVSPKGSTPAFADSRNISMIGMGGDKYLRTIPALKTFYITWDSVPQMAVPTGSKVVDGKAGIVFSAEDIPYEFVSKSGGEILQDVLFARKLMWYVFAGIDTTRETCIMVPRVNSLLVVTSTDGKSLREAFDLMKAKYPMIQLIEGTRA